MFRAQICSLRQASHFKTIEGYRCPHIKLGLQVSHAVCKLHNAEGIKSNPDPPEAGKQCSVPGLLRCPLAWQFSG